MFLVNKDLLESYKRNDWVQNALHEHELSFEREVTTQKWLKDSEAKRLIFSQLYGDLINDNRSSSSILDVGGGYTSLSKVIAERHNYELIEIFAHESEANKTNIRAILKDCKVHTNDWHELSPQLDFDYIIANDLFPNVDQRLNVFLSKYLPRCKKLRVSLTFYDNSRFYKVKRTDADEIFWYVPWNRNQLNALLLNYQKSILNFNPHWIQDFPESIYPNKRQVLIVEFQGKL
jgi:hypothetical protein